MDTKQQLKNLAFDVNEILNLYIQIHNNLMKDSSSFWSLFKKIDFQKYNNEINAVFIKSIQIFQEIENWEQLIKNDLTEGEILFIEQLKKYTLALIKTIKVLMKLTYRLLEKSKGSKGTNLFWTEYKQIWKEYEKARNEYFSHGGELNHLYQKILAS